MNSLDLDDANPESDPDLDKSSLGSFVSDVGSSLGSEDQQDEAALSLDNLGHRMMTIGSSLGSLDQQQQDGQEGQTIGTAWEPSLEQTKESFARTKPKKRVTFSKATLAAYNDKQQNKEQNQNKGSHPESSQLEQLEHRKKKNNNENSCKDSLGKHNELPNDRCKTTLACWNLVPQEHQRKKQQQPATASKKNMEHKRCIDNNSLDGEDECLGSLESQTQTQQACRSPKHNNNTSSLGIGSKNKAAWGIMIDTGAAISLAPMSFAPES